MRKRRHMDCAKYLVKMHGNRARFVALGFAVGKDKPYWMQVLDCIDIVFRRVGRPNTGGEYV
jgi:hypothetical protein